MGRGGQHWGHAIPRAFHMSHANLALLPQIEAEDQELATFCGRETTDTEQAPGQQVILSPGPYMGLTFRSDFSNEERFTGFDAHYTAVGKGCLNFRM